MVPEAFGTQVAPAAVGVRQVFPQEGNGHCSKIIFHPFLAASTRWLILVASM